MIGDIISEIYSILLFEPSIQNPVCFSDSPGNVDSDQPPVRCPKPRWAVAATLVRTAGGELRLLSLSPFPPARPMVPPLIPPKIPEGERVDFDVSKGPPVPRCLCAN